MLEAVIAIVVVVVLGGAYLAFRHRSERGIESGISSFRRELSALAPRREPRVAPKTRSAPDPDDVETDPESTADPEDPSDGADPAG
jgi:hypothetical protein